MVGDYPVLLAVGARLVTAHPAADLLAPRSLQLLSFLTARSRVELFDHGLHRLLLRVLPRTALGLSHDPRRHVDQPARVLVLVAVLPARTCAAVPLDPEVIWEATEEPLIDRNERIDDRYSHRRGVNPALPFSRRDPLPPMTACFVPLEICEDAGRALNRKAESTYAAVDDAC